mmetsp:Transcript_5453/g.15621  ORF Transcript_5453/g.15621 Transcript_5453/m.15621 type:complete len:91 (+) Transcript_5453:1412-1684(+)
MWGTAMTRRLLSALLERSAPSHATRKPTKNIVKRKGSNRLNLPAWSKIRSQIPRFTGRKRVGGILQQSSIRMSFIKGQTMLQVHTRKAKM